MPAIGLAVFSKSAETVTVLLDAQPHAANQQFKDARGKTQPPLESAAYTKQPAVVEALLKAGADTRWTSADGLSMLAISIVGNDIEDLRQLVAAGADAKQFRSRHSSLLHLASSQDRPEIIKALVEYGLDPNQANDFGISPLEVAAGAGAVESARILLVLGAATYPMDTFGDTALSLARRTVKDATKSAAMVQLLSTHGAPADGTIRPVDQSYLEAIHRGDLAGVKAALAAGADINARRHADVNLAVSEAASLAAPHPQVLAYLIEHGISLTACNSYEFTALHYAAGREGNIQSIELIVKQGVDINQKSKYGDTPLSMAVNQNVPSAVATLLKLGADATVHGPGGKNLLQLAREGNRSALIAPMLEKAGATPDPPGTPQPCEVKGDATPACSLPFFVQAANFDRVSRALDGGADINARDPQGRTLLMIALSLPKTKENVLVHTDEFLGSVVARRIRIAHYLIEHGIDVGAHDSRGIGALHYVAADPRLAEFVDVLIKKGANPNLKGGDIGYTPLMLAAQSGNLSGAEALLKNGASLNVSTSAGHTALKVAMIGGQHEMVTLLLSSGADPDFDGGVPPTPRKMSLGMDASMQAAFGAGH